MPAWAQKTQSNGAIKELLTQGGNLSRHDMCEKTKPACKQLYDDKSAPSYLGGKNGICKITNLGQRFHFALTETAKHISVPHRKSVHFVMLITEQKYI